MAADITEAAERVATISGVALRPGVSKNGRRYTAENIARAHRRLTARVKDPNGRPVVMRTHHPGSKSDLDVTNIAGRVTGASLDEAGALHYTADIPDTAAGRDVAALVTPKSPFLSNVSIRGWWVGEPIQTADGNETADDLEIDGLDFTPNPGVDGARITSAALAEDVRGRHPITESAEDPIVTIVETTEAAKDALTPGSDYADPGYQADKKKRYPLDSKRHVLAAWSFINQANNQKPYSAAQLKRVKSRIKAALKRYGVDKNNSESFLEAATELIDEAWASVNLDNGQGTVNVSGYTNEPADLPAIGRRTALAALAGLLALDPDNDGDIDLADNPNDTDDGMAPCPDCGAPVEPGANFCPTCGASMATTESATDPLVAAKANQKEGVIVTTTETAATATETNTEEAAPAVVTEETIAAAVAKGVSEALSALQGATNTTTEATKPTEVIAETSRTDIIEGIRAMKDEFDGKVAEMRDELVALYRSGGRRGLVRKAEESTDDAKPLHEMSDEEFKAHATEVWTSVLPVQR